MFAKIILMFHIYPFILAIYLTTDDHNDIFSIHQQYQYQKKFPIQRFNCRTLTHSPGYFRFQVDWPDPNEQSIREEKHCLTRIISPVDTLIRVRLIAINFQCNDSNSYQMSYIDLFDGWNVYSGWTIPTDGEHKLNFMQIEFYLPYQHSRFDIQVMFIMNPKPCNVLIIPYRQPDWNGTHTIDSYYPICTVYLLQFGGRIELFPTINVHIVNYQLGFKVLKTPYIRRPCSQFVNDYVEIGGTSTTMEIDGTPESVKDICSEEKKPTNITYNIRCRHAVIRLHSAGRIKNFFQFNYELSMFDYGDLTKSKDQIKPTYIHCSAFG
ncbi:corticotropin-releasing factor-binding protein [Dermatophagoides farinae]|uniref:Corticotropin-releasing factor-binding protein n=1 Tax=Dermatophagoides farinae TaxID=6954 RepID=A0A9D4SJ83_DERFA|nr:corticotropin-releasing factor-binding protein [Dermatophagoides farinae]